MTKFTPTQQKMLDVLADGLPHTFDELHACLPDELGERKNISKHISRARKVLRSKGQDIVCVFRHRRKWYQHIMLYVPEGMYGQ